MTTREACAPAGPLVTDTKQRRRPRLRFASDAEIERAAAMSLKLGLALELRGDGSVRILGKLDSYPVDGATSADEEETPDEALERWRRESGAARHS